MQVQVSDIRMEIDLRIQLEDFRNVRDAVPRVGDSGGVAWSFTGCPVAKKAQPFGAKKLGGLVTEPRWHATPIQSAANAAVLARSCF